MAIIGYFGGVPCINADSFEFIGLAQRIGGERPDKTWHVSKTEYCSFAGASGEQKLYEVTHYLREMPVSWGQRIKCITAIFFSILFFGIPLLFPCVRECIVRVWKGGELCYLVQPLSDDTRKQRIVGGDYQLIEDETDLDALEERLQQFPVLFTDVFQAIARKYGANSGFLVRFCLKHPDQIRSAVKSYPPAEVGRFLVALIQEEAYRQTELTSKNSELDVRALGAGRFKLHETAINGWFPHLIDDGVMIEEDKLNIFNNPQLVRQLVYELGIPVIAYIDSALLENAQFVQSLQVEIPSESSKLQGAVRAALMAR